MRNGLTQFQALVVGALLGCLMKQDFMTIDAEAVISEGGDYTNEILVTGRESGEKLRIVVEVVT